MKIVTDFYLYLLGEETETEIVVQKYDSTK